MIFLAGTLALCSFGLEMTIGTFLGHPLMAVCDMTIRMDILHNLKQGNQLHLIWAFFGPNFGPNFGPKLGLLAQGAKLKWGLRWHFGSAVIDLM